MRRIVAWIGASASSHGSLSGCNRVSPVTALLDRDATPQLLMLRESWSERKGQWRSDDMPMTTTM